MRYAPAVAAAVGCRLVGPGRIGNLDRCLPRYQRLSSLGLGVAEAVGAAGAEWIQESLEQ